jgi:hypothetical protein
MAGYTTPYLEPRQTLTRPISDWENELAGALEAAFGRGAHELPALVEALNASWVRPPSGEPWTEASFTRIIAELGA